MWLILPLSGRSASLADASLFRELPDAFHRGISTGSNWLASLPGERYVLAMTWAEICEDKLLVTLPYRIESDRWGNVVMSPPPRSRHAEYQAEIAVLLRTKLPG